VEQQLRQEWLKEQGLLTIGENTYGHFDVDWYKGSEAKLTIGKFCSISPKVRFITGGIHPLDWTALYPFRIYWGLEGAYQDGTPSTKGPICIGCDVWIGTGATILSGVTIGHGAVVMAESVVSKDIPPYCIAGGVPAKIIGKRFDDDTIGRLLEIQWWDWSREKILQNIYLLNSARVGEFVRLHTKAAEEKA
jgi:acetyltransferase-like isoleucine patch superfamily enzyme